MQTVNFRKLKEIADSVVDEFKPPAGTEPFTVQVTDAHMNRTKKDSGVVFNIQLEALDGEFAGKKFLASAFVTGKPFAVKRGLETLVSLGVPEELFDSEEANPAHICSAMIDEIRTLDPKWNGEYYNPVYTEVVGSGTTSKSTTAKKATTRRPAKAADPFG